ncbi:small ribosomal subunit biogenesis GTPase RsgA [Teredinibacter purpureus]|uniref:small ribosomal subunit biogenesis GTPase RsgA n=1 Tax=Teredinibacter purpureus TaxID=2731756 RepID=UPI0005F7E8B0|nr:small ribosomal subunit biogenesis GTPase RsgA [Teredinibacter purpureus]
MTKRKLSQQQSRRIEENQKKRRKNADNEGRSSAPEQHGTVITRYGKQADIETADGTLWRCYLRANLGEIVTGDNVIWQQEDDNCGVVVSVMQSRNRLQRPDSYGKMRDVAANIDQVLITLAVEPEPHAGLIDRYLVVAENLDVKPVLLLNKADLLGEPESCSIQQLLHQYKLLGYDVVLASSKSEHGLDTLKVHLRNVTSIFAGQSGVGKSSIIQLLLPNEDIKIGELSEQIAKGRHTTTHSRLYHFPDGGNCIDSPGIRDFGLWHMNVDDVIHGFIELRQRAGHCKFRDCRHQQEPGCAITSAQQDGIISAERYESFCRIINTLNDVDIKPSL